MIDYEYDMDIAESIQEVIESIKSYKEDEFKIDSISIDSPEIYPLVFIIWYKKEKSCQTVSAGSTRTGPECLFP